jgi:hypothetical protein
VGGLLIPQNIQQGIGETEHGRGIHTLGRDDRSVDERKMRPVDQRHGIEKEKPLGHGRHPTNPLLRRPQIKDSVPGSMTKIHHSRHVSILKR